VVVVDTSVLVEVDRGNPVATALVRDLLEADAVAVSVVTVYEMLAGPTTRATEAEFWQRFFEHVEVMPVLAILGTLGAAGARAAGGMAAADGLIAATAAAYGRQVVTSDRSFLRFPGLEVKWVEPLRSQAH
jgi:predicted nucleic acid-binding protein